MAVKRRTVWLDDEDWRRLALLGRTRSQAIHQWVAPEGVKPVPRGHGIRVVHSTFGVSPMPDPPDPNFHPVPKPGKK